MSIRVCEGLDCHRISIKYTTEEGTDKLIDSDIIPRSCAN